MQNTICNFTTENLKTINVKTKSFKQRSCSNATAYKIMCNAQTLVNEKFENDSTASRYYVMQANIYASVVQFFYENVENEYVCINSLLTCITKHLVYFDDSCLFYACTKNTLLANENLDNYAYLAN